MPSMFVWGLGRLTLLLLAGVLIGAACGGDDDDPSGDARPATAAEVARIVSTWADAVP
jgi:hypothetical protein